MPFIELRNVSKAFETGSDHSTVEVLQGFSMSVGSQEIVSMFGPNGCGKTTILNLVAGLVCPDGGTATVAGLPPGRLRTAFIFQNFQQTLLPWRTCLGNLSFPLEMHGMRRERARHEAVKFLEAVRIVLPLRKYPYQLSGGQQQLLALCRALVSQPELLLLDEPFGALDYDRRTEMEDALLRLLADTKVTALLVSHEVDEAIYLADRVLVLGASPTRVVADIPVDLPKPRTMDVLKSDRFSQLRKDIILSFREGRAQ